MSRHGADETGAGPGTDEADEAGLGAVRRINLE